ncbi:MAG: 50S ribosomal protein L3 [Armatimonadetes bacterium]|nr:50S ribosomal protein L3 [Armatimonadota bacterium]
MPAGLLGRKIGMTRIFDDRGHAVAVTVIQAGPCVVVQRKTADRDGYEAIQVGFEELPLRKSNMPYTGHFQKRGLKPLRFLREFRLSEGEDYHEGQRLTVELFPVGEKVDVTGTSKGRGFAGGVKRHGFSGGPASHGSKVHRSPMSAGSTDAARTFPGKRSPGHMGNERVTVQSLTVVRVDPQNNLIIVKGAVPGPRGGLVVVRPSVKAKAKK